MVYVPLSDLKTDRLKLKPKPKLEASDVNQSLTHVTIVSDISKWLLLIGNRQVNKVNVSFTQEELTTHAIKMPQPDIFLPFEQLMYLKI